MKKTDENKKKKIIIGIIIFIVLAIIAISIILLNIKDSNKQLNKQKENSSEIEESKDYIILNDNLNYEINSDVKLISLISNSNKYNILNENETIDTSVLGKKEITIKYEVNKSIKEKTVIINIVDTEAPVIEYKKELSTTVGTSIDLLKGVKASDNSKEEINVTIEGKYDFNKEGTYNLKYVAVDSSNNKKEEKFILKVNKKATKPSNGSSKPQTSNNITNNEDNNESKKKKCTPAKALPEGAVWYKLWGEESASYSEYLNWADSIDDMKMLYDELDKMESAYGGNDFRTDGGLVQVNCKGENFYIYGAYIVINGYESYLDDSGKQVEVQTEKGYVRPNGTITWVYKKY